MFDKYLCKSVHKKEITIGDVLEQVYDMYYPYILVAVLGLLTATMFIRDTMLKESISVIPATMIFIDRVIEFAMVLGATLLFGYILFILIRKICTIEVAKCPNQKE